MPLPNMESGARRKHALITAGQDAILKTFLFSNILMFGRIVVIDEHGYDGEKLHLTSGDLHAYTFGSDNCCDVVVSQEGVIKEHLKVTCDSTHRVYLSNLSADSKLYVKINGKVIKQCGTEQLVHGDKFSLGDRQFRLEKYKDGNIKKKKSVKAVKDRSRRRRKLKKQRYLERGKGKETDNESCKIHEDLDQRSDNSKKEVKRKPKSDKFKEMMEDVLFSGMIQYHQSSRYAEYIRRANQKIPDIYIE